MSKNKNKNFSNQIFFKVDAKQVTLIPGQVIYVSEPKEETDKKMKSEKWSTQIAKSRHYMFICSDGRFATVIPLSSEPPKNPFQVQFVDHMRSGLTLTVRCDQKCKLPLTRLVEGKYSNFKGIAYTFDKQTTMKLIGYSMMYELHQWYDLEESQAMLDLAWRDKETMLNSFKNEFNNMDYDFKHGPQSNYDSNDEYITEISEELAEDDESDIITSLQRQIEDLSTKLSNISIASTNPATETIESEKEEIVYVPEVAEEIKEDVIEEEIKDSEKPVNLDVDFANEEDTKELPKVPNSSDDTLTTEFIKDRQTAINTYSLMENLKAIRKAKGVKVDPKIDTSVSILSEEEMRKVTLEVPDSLIQTSPSTVAEGSHLNSEFSILDSIKFPSSAPLSAKGNSINAFVNYECTKTKTEYTSLRVIFAAYKKYCQSTGLWCATLGDLKCYLILHGYKVERLIIDQKDRPMDAVNIVLKAQLKIIEQSKIDNNLIKSDKEETVTASDSEEDNAPKVTFKGNRVVWTDELVEYAENLLSSNPDKAIDVFHYKNIKSLKATVSSYKKKVAK